jgi:hypothetical protein
MATAATIIITRKAAFFRYFTGKPDTGLILAVM